MEIYKIELIDDGNIISDSIVMGNVFNNLFVNAVDTEIIQHINPQNKYKQDNNTPSSYNTKFRSKQIYKEILEKIVTWFENKYSAGLDNLSVTLVKQSLPLISKPLTHIVNSSLISRFFST